jgi:diaminohydroxyphosphoribosylaminopyrimidine deaminase/5-amino-6-(5-phosphoribosylamino)uracil reductase
MAGAADDVRFLRHALRLATRGWGRVAPNPLVGAVVVRDGQVIGEGWHPWLGAPHAEPIALAEAGEAARGATLYVTLEPCNHEGRTPPCTEAILAAGIARVVYAAADPNPVAAGGADRLRAHGVAVEQVDIGPEATELIAPFLHAARGASRPWVTLKLAVSLDGAIADHTRQPGWITGPKARREVHRLRAGADAIAVGLGTALADDPHLTVRHGQPVRVPPARVVFDREARLPTTSHLVRTLAEAPVWIVVAPEAADHAARARRAALAALGVHLVPADTPAAALIALRRDGVQHLLVEGGAGLAGRLLGTNSVDRLIIFQGSVILGAGAVPAFSGLAPRTVAEALRLRTIARRTVGDDLMTTYAVSEG